MAGCRITFVHAHGSKVSENVAAVFVDHTGETRRMCDGTNLKKRQYTSS
jgi:hypothetical protein